MTTNPTTCLKPCIRPAVLARKIGVHSATLIRWCVAGRVAAWRTPGGRWRIHLSAARELMRAAGVDQNP